MKIRARIALCVCLLDGWKKMKLTPSQVKNIMRRGLRLLIDPNPEPEQRAQCVEYFGHICAYCDDDVAKGQGDLDHLLSSAKGGRNHISNRVFSCKRCNAEEKREKQWESFLLDKYGPGPVFNERRSKILGWVAIAGDVPPLSDEMLEILEAQSRAVVAGYDEACKMIRAQQGAQDRRPEHSA
jgi:hypothetical protein